MGRKRKNKQYFTDETENAIVLYNQTNDIRKKNDIFMKHIYNPFQKIITGMLQSHKFDYINMNHEDLKDEVLTHLFKGLPKYKKDVGNAFSYFSVACKWYLVQKNDRAYNNLKRKCEVDSIDTERRVMNEISRADKVGVLTDFMNEYVTYMDDNLYVIFRESNEIKIADSLIEIFRNRELIEEYNRKSIYLLIRDRTGVNTTEISKVVNVMQEYYNRLYKNYLRTGNITVTGSFW